jgi:serine protease Do
MQPSGVGPRKLSWVAARVAAALGLFVALWGCETIPDKVSAGDLSKIVISDMLSSELRKVTSLVNEKRFAEARDFAKKEATYFNDRLSDSARPHPEAIKTLGEYVFNTEFKGKIELALSTLRKIQALSPPSTWPEVNQALQNGDSLQNSMSKELLIKESASSTQAAIELKSEISRVRNLATQSRPAIFMETIDFVLAHGKHAGQGVAGITFSFSDYQRSRIFQNRAIDKISGITDPEAYFKEAKTLLPYLAPISKQNLDSKFETLARKAISSRGPSTIENVFSPTVFFTPFSAKRISSHDNLKIGLSVFEQPDRQAKFRLSTSKPSTLIVEEISASNDLRKNAPSSDFLLVLRSREAKIERAQSDSNSVSSREKIGTRSVSNPAWASAMIRYQSAQTEYQLAERRMASFPTTCYDNACALNKFAAQLGLSNASSAFSKASQDFASTPQTIIEDVFRTYSYRTVTIKSERKVTVESYVFDIKGSGYSSKSSQHGESKVFNVAYGIRDNDPDATTIKRRFSQESEVLAWEQRPFLLNADELFNARAWASAAPIPIESVISLVDSLKSGDPLSKSASSQSRNSDGSSRSGAPAVFVDERFKSVVEVQGESGVGAGFYVAPNLVLTSHHVVGGRRLVRLTDIGGRSFSGTVTSVDERLDLALISTSTQGVALKIHEGPIRLGTAVEAIGHPRGYRYSITRGVISSIRKNRSTTVDSDALVEYVQTDTPISPGNSGGPLLLGEYVVGVNDWARVDKGSQSLNFSVSFNEIKGFLGRTGASNR